MLADAGYSSGEHLHKLQSCRMQVLLPPARAVNNHGEGTLYERSMFEYDRHSDTYRCPAGQILTRRSQSLRDKQYVYAADKGVCGSCARRASSSRHGASEHFAWQVIKASVPARPASG